MEAPLKKGDRVGEGYVVDRMLGIGGMAAVGLGIHETQRHQVAIKMMLPESASRQDVLKRFEREQRMLMQLHSEHVLRIYGAGQHNGLPYMLLEYLRGEDLEAYLKNRGPLPIDRAVECILQACHAIAEAHSLGITHRDLKPGNLFLTRRTDGSPCIKVLDFGISKISYGGDNPEESILTKTTMVMGSPFYMSPEQMLSSKDVDPRSDIWALGVTLYELMTKTLPFAAESVNAVCQRILHGEPTPLRKIRPTFPGALEKIILRCLRRRPAERYQNVSDLARELQDFGPDHGHYCVDAICDLIPPTAPHERTDIDAPDVAVKDNTTTQASSTTTVYLDAGAKPSGTPWWLAGGMAVLAFGVGVGVGWATSLNTDPTQGAGVAVKAPLPPPPAAPAPAPEPAQAKPARSAPPEASAAPSASEPPAPKPAAPKKAGAPKPIAPPRGLPKPAGPVPKAPATAAPKPPSGAPSLRRDFTF